MKNGAIKEQILIAALSVLSGRGYDGTTVQRIADEIGMTKTGVLHHFRSREVLLLEALASRDAADSAGTRSDDPLIALAALAEHNQTIRGLVSLFVTTTALAAADTVESERRTFALVRYERLLAKLTENVSLEQSAGRVTDLLAAESVARIMIAAMDGLQVQWLLTPEVDMSAQLHGLISLLRPQTSA